MRLRVNGGAERLAEIIKEAREDANLSQVEFAALLGVSSRTVQYWEAGKVPQPKHRRALAAFLDGDAEQVA